MQISFDTATVTKRELQLIGVIIDMLSEKPASVTVENHSKDVRLTIAPADAPNVGLDTAAMFAPSTAVVATPPIVPAAPTATLPLPLPVAPVASLPLPPAVVPPVVPGAPVGFDAEGLPWDERIHSSNHKQGADGMWQLKRGMGNDPARVQRIKAELRQLQALPVGAPAQVTIPAPVFPQAPSLTLPLPAPTPTNLSELMVQCGPMFAAQTLTPQKLQDAATAIGVPQLSMLATVERPDLIKLIWDQVKG